MLTIVIPVRSNQGLADFIKANEPYFKRHAVIVVDSGGGEDLEKYCEIYVKEQMPFWEARKLAYSFVKTRCILNLDLNVIIPQGYIEDSLELLEIEKIGAVSIFFEGEEGEIRPHRGILEYGISLWKAGLLKRIYDYNPSKERNDWCCECLYMWRKLHQEGYRLETLPYRAKHLRR